MKKQKLGLNDFEALETKELLEVKGGYRPHVFHSRHAILAEGGGGGGGANSGCCCSGQWTTGDFIANGVASDITSFMNNAYGTAQDIGNAALETAIEWGDNFLDRISPVKVITPPFLKYIDPNLMPPHNNFPTTASSGNGCN